jgi:hypothetical protein
MRNRYDLLLLVKNKYSFAILKSIPWQSHNIEYKRFIILLDLFDLKTNKAV